MRYQNGTNVSRRSRRTTVGDVVGDVLRADHDAAEEGALQDLVVREALRLDEAGVDGVDAHAARAELGGAGARERDLRVLRRGVRAGGPERDRSGDRDDVDDVRRGRGLEPRQERAQAPDAAEVVGAHHLLDPVDVGRDEVAAARDARVVDEQLHARDGARAPPPATRSTASPVGDVADLGLAAELGRERLDPVAPAGEQDREPAVAREPPRERLADPRRGAGDHRDAAARPLLAGA